MENSADLLSAIENKNVQGIIRLLEEEINTNEWYQNANSLLTAAVRSQDLSIVKLVTKHFKRRIYYYWGSNSILHEAVELGDLSIIQYLLNQYPMILVDDVDSEYRTPLYIATKHKNIPVMRYLLNKGAEANGTEFKETYLHIAVRLGSLEMVNLLLKNNAQVHVFDENNISPLHCAIKRGDSKMAQVLIRAVGKLNYMQPNEYIVLTDAIRNNMTEVVKDFIQFGGKIAHDNVHLAVEMGNLKIVKILHRAGASLACVDVDGDTPLMKAWLNKQFSIAEYLLEHGGHRYLRAHKAVCDEYLRGSHSNLGFDLEHDLHCAYVFAYALDNFHFVAARTLVKYALVVDYINYRWLQRCFVDTETRESLERQSMLHDLIKCLYCAGYNFKPQMLKNINVADAILDFVNSSINNPRSLQDLCRIRIRKLLGKRSWINLYKLDIPEIIHQFLAFDILSFSSASCYDYLKRAKNYGLQNMLAPRRKTTTRGYTFKI